MSSCNVSLDEINKKNQYFIGAGLIVTLTVFLINF